MDASLIVQAISDEIFHIVKAVSEDPHVVRETAQTIARFDTAMLGAMEYNAILS